MSNEEKLKRARYRKLRNTMIIVLVVILSLTFAGTLYSGIKYYNLNKEEYVTYSEKSNTNYLVYLKDNPFYDKEYLEKGDSYVASIIDSIEGQFEYRLLMDTVGVSFNYSYWIDAELEIVDNTSGRVIYKPVDNLVQNKTYKIASANCIHITDKVTISYDEYNDFASDFISAYNLENSTSNVLIKLHVEINENASHFANEVNNSYVVSINIPLTKQTVNIDITSTIPTSVQKVLLIEDIELNNFYKHLTILLAIVELILVIMFVLFLYLTRNNDINYSIKIKKIINNYKSYIQRILNPFEYDAYKVIKLSSFTEMLDIRDTVRSPILMYENEDQTCSTFVIPTNTDLLYLYEIKVADYEEIYSQPVQAVETVSYPQEESTMISNNEQVYMSKEQVELYVQQMLEKYEQEHPQTIIQEQPKPTNEIKTVKVIKEVVVKEVPCEDLPVVENTSVKEDRSIKKVIRLEHKEFVPEEKTKIKKVKKQKEKKINNKDIFTLVTRKTSLEGTTHPKEPNLRKSLKKK